MPEVKNPLVLRDAPATTANPAPDVKPHAFPESASAPSTASTTSSSSSSGPESDMDQNPVRIARDAFRPGEAALQQPVLASLPPSSPHTAAGQVSSLADDSNLNVEPQDRHGTFNIGFGDGLNVQVAGQERDHINVYEEPASGRPWETLVPQGSHNVQVNMVQVPPLTPALNSLLGFLAKASCNPCPLSNLQDVPATTAPAKPITQAVPAKPVPEETNITINVSLRLQLRSA
jgi:hypothetical protein